MRIALATTCKGRGAHLAVTLPENLRNLPKDASIVLLDYNDPDGLGDYIAKEHAADLNSGKLVYYRNNEPPYFEMAKAKNQAHRCAVREGADVIVNLDADNFAPEGFVPYVERRFREADDYQEAVFLGARANHRGPGGLTQLKTPPGCFGRIGVSVQAFRHAGGYDEIFSGHSADDKDFAARVGRIGYGWRQIHPRFLRAIKHGAAVRYANYKEGQEYFDEGQVLEARENERVVNAGHIGEGIVYRNFSPEPIEIKSIPTRIFGVGVHRTGTTSLDRAFKILGFDSAHWCSPHWSRYIYTEMIETGRSRTLEGHYALTDFPIPLLYKQLDAGYPGAKFILTVREENAWLESVRTHWKLQPTWEDYFSNEVHELFYGTRDFDEQVFRARYRQHNEEVIEYFRGRPDDLMVMNVDQKATLAPLCSFLNLPVVDWPFPHRHKSAEQAKYMEN